MASAVIRSIRSEQRVPRSSRGTIVRASGPSVNAAPVRGSSHVNYPDVVRANQQSASRQHQVNANRLIDCYMPKRRSRPAGRDRVAQDTEPTPSTSGQHQDMGRPDGVPPPMVLEPRARRQTQGRSAPPVARAAASTRQSLDNIHRTSQENRLSMISSGSDFAINFSDEQELIRSGGEGPSNRIQTGILNPGITLLESETPRGNAALPDIVSSANLPPYTPRPNQHRGSRNDNQNRLSGNLTQTDISIDVRQTRSRRDPRRAPSVDSSRSSSKGCCSSENVFHCLTVLTTFRWVLVVLAMLGVCCVVTGIVLGALHMAGSSFLTLSLMFIGLGVMLVIVVGVGWKCTPLGHEPCHLLFNLGEHSTRDIAIERIRHPRDRNQWYAGTIYPEFRFRRPPPSYAASMQDYQNQQLLAQIRQQQRVDEQQSGEGPCMEGLPTSPPPSYRSQVSVARPGLHITFPDSSGEYPQSRPPTYRSTAGTLSRPGLPISMQPNADSVPSTSGLQNIDNIQPSTSGLQNIDNVQPSTSGLQNVESVQPSTSGVYMHQRSGSTVTFGSVEIMDSETSSDQSRQSTSERPNTLNNSVQQNTLVQSEQTNTHNESHEADSRQLYHSHPDAILTSSASTNIEIAEVHKPRTANPVSSIPLNTHSGSNSPALNHNVIRIDNSNSLSSTPERQLNSNPDFSTIDRGMKIVESMEVMLDESLNNSQIDLPSLTSTGPVNNTHL